MLPSGRSPAGAIYAPPPMSRTTALHDTRKRRNIRHACQHITARLQRGRQIRLYQRDRQQHQFRCSWNHRLFDFPFTVMTGRRNPATLADSQRETHAPVSTVGRLHHRVGRVQQREQGLADFSSEIAQVFFLSAPRRST